MDKANVLVIPAAGNPAEHAATVIVNPIPHHLADKPPHLLKALATIKLAGSDGDVISNAFRNLLARIIDEVSLATACSNAWVSFHARHQTFEIAVGQDQIKIQFADVVELLDINSVQACVEGVNDTGADAAFAAIFTTNDFDSVVLGCIFSENLRGFVGRSIIDNNKQLRRHGLLNQTVKRLAGELGFVSTGCNNQIVAHEVSPVRYPLGWD